MYKLLLLLLLAHVCAFGQFVTTGTTATTNPVYTNGKVGIGNSSPSYELDINGTLPYIRLHSSDFSNNPPGLTKIAGIIFNQENSDKTSAITGAVPPGYHVPGILFSTKTAWNVPGPAATAWYDRMFIHPNGNVGIDNMNPATRLHVNGAIRLDGNASLPTDATANSSSNYTSNFNFKLASNNNGFYVTVSNVASDRKTFLQSGHESTQYAYGVGTLSLNPFGGSVGIGTTSPGPNSKLDIKSPLGAEAIRILDDSSQPRLAIGQIANYGGNLIDSKNIDLLLQTYSDTGTGGNLIFKTGTATAMGERMRINPNGDIGIGITPLAKLHVNGAMRVDGNVPLPTNALASDNFNYVSKYNFKVANNNNGFYIAVSNTASERKTYLQSGHENADYAYGTGTLSLNPFGGNVGIGTTNPTQKLEVKGTVYSTEVKVDLNAGAGPDYVFEKDYALPSLESVKTYIDQNKHLPEVPSAKEMEANGINLSEMNMLLLKKVEELTLYVIEQQKQINELKKKQ